MPRRHSPLCKSLSSKTIATIEQTLRAFHVPPRNGNRQFAQISQFHANSIHRSLMNS
jgi:hypothetical protein